MYAAVNGIPIVRAFMQIPAWGIWHADVWLDRDATVSGAVTLSLADISATGTTTRSVSFLGQRGVRIVGGAGGWRQVVPSWQYANPTGLTLSTILNHTAATIGETVIVPSDTAVGTAWVRSEGPAGRLIQSLIPGAWYVGFDGKTYASARPAGAVATTFTPVGATQPAGMYTIATENPGDWLPGKTFAGPAISGTISRVMHRVDKATLRTEVVSV